MFEYVLYDKMYILFYRDFIAFSKISTCIHRFTEKRFFFLFQIGTEFFGFGQDPIMTM